MTDIHGTQNIKRVIQTDSETDMKKTQSSGKKTAYRILAVFLAALFFLGTYATIRSNIRFSRMKYVEDTARFAADITGDGAEYLSENRLERSWKILRTLIKKPQTYEDYDLYASIAIAREDLEGAAGYLQGCIDTCEGTASELAVLHMRRGSLFILQEAAEPAMQELDMALESDPYLAPAYYLRAQLHAGNEETEKALADYRTYISLEGRDPEITASLAEVFEAAGEPENALLCYDTGIETGTSDGPERYAGRARCRIASGDASGAKADLEQYFTLTDEDPGGAAAAMLGMCRMDAGDYKGASEMFSRALESGYSDTATLYEQSMLCHYASEEYEAASEDGEKAVEAAENAGSDPAEAHFWTGMAYMAQKEYPDAREHLAAVEAADPDRQDIHYYLGVCAMAIEEDEKAAEEFTASLAREENTAECLYNRAVCYIRLNRPEEAQRDLEEAAEKEDTEIAADALELLEDLKEAMEEAGMGSAGQAEEIRITAEPG